MHLRTLLIGLLSLSIGGWSLYAPILQNQYETEFNRHKDAFNQEEWDRKLREMQWNSHPASAS